MKEIQNSGHYHPHQKYEGKMKEKCFLLFTTLLLTYTGAIYGQTEENLPPPDQSFIQTLVMIAIAGLFFYFILWKPEQKRRKAMEEQRSALKKGDRVAAMGILGTVVKVGDQTVILKMYDGTKLEFYKAAVTDILPQEEEGNKKGDSSTEE